MAHLGVKGIFWRRTTIWWCWRRLWFRLNYWWELWLPPPPCLSAPPITGQVTSLSLPPDVTPWHVTAPSDFVTPNPRDDGSEVLWPLLPNLQSINFTVVREQGANKEIKFLSSLQNWFFDKELWFLVWLSLRYISAAKFSLSWCPNVSRVTFLSGCGCLSSRMHLLGCNSHANTQTGPSLFSAGIPSRTFFFFHFSKSKVYCVLPTHWDCPTEFISVINPINIWVPYKRVNARDRRQEWIPETRDRGRNAAPRFWDLNPNEMLENCTDWMFRCFSAVASTTV